MPPRQRVHRTQRILKAYGAEMVFSDPSESSDGAIRKCREIYEADPDRYFYPDQYNNPANWKAHFETTGREIVEQTSGLLTHFVAAMGTSGSSPASAAGSIAICRMSNATPGSLPPAFTAWKD